MAENSAKSLIKDTYRRIFLPLVAAAISTVILVFCVLTVLEINTRGIEGYEKATRYLLIIFIFLALSNLVTFFKEKTKLNLLRCVIIFSYDIVLGIVILFGHKNPYLFCLVTGLYCIGVIASRVFNMIQKRTPRAFVLNGMVIATFILLAIMVLASYKDETETINSFILLECLMVAISSFAHVFTMALSQLKLKVLGTIILKTYALEILFGLFTMMVCFSLVFMFVEPGFENFGDGLWYCFAVVTTIGFGDYTCVTLTGRILTGVLGIYGLIVVAVITSIFVNFYNETSGKNDKKELKNIKKEENKDK